MISRRAFTAGAGAALAGIITSRPRASATTVEQSLKIDTSAEIGVIRPELHSHFAEHLGTCTYGGLWVGRNSRIPNINGYRRQAIEYLKAVGIPVLRWPGGCFADDYHWRDGIGPVEKRPKSVNIHWGNYTEDNSFGTHEFIGLCRLIGAEPYLAGNVGSGTPRELRDWVEYCNYPAGTTLSDERARNGSPEPFRVKYWGVGNENWGCGGSMMPEEYAGHYRRFSTYVRNFGDTPPFMIACGPNRNNVDWTKRFLDNTRGFALRRVHGYAMHYYSNGREPATKFTVDEMRRQLSTFADLEKGIGEQRALLDTVDSQRRIGLMVDEWGIWDRMVPEEEKKYGRLWQQIPMRCAVGAAMGLNVFHRQADKLYMCNIAQIVNVLHSLLLTYEDKCVRTSTYYAFDLMKGHRSKRALKVETGDESPLGLSTSASREGRSLVVTLVNPKHDTALALTASVAGTAVAGATARLLHHPDWNACNTFDNPDTIVPKNHTVAVQGSSMKLELPPLSVVTVQATLA